MFQKSDSDRTTPSHNLDIDYEDAIGHLHGDSEFSGPVSKRSCTDVLFLIIFIISNLCLIGISTYIILKGDPSRLSKGFDIRANTCGLDQLSEKRFMFFPNSSNTDWSLCVEACPYYFYDNYYCIYDRDDTEKYLTEWGCFDAYETTAYGFFCVPAGKGRYTIMQYLSEPIQVIKRASGDIYLAWDSILIGHCASMIIGLIYLFLLQIAIVAKTLVLITVGFITLLVAGLSILFFESGKRALKQECGDYGPVDPGYCSYSAYHLYYGLTIAASALFAIYLFRIFKKYPNFTIGYQMIELTSKPLKVMTQLAIFPLAQILVGNGILLMLVVIIGWNMSASTKTKIESEYIPGGKSYVLKFSALENYMLAFNVFMSIWWCSFIVDLGKFVMSGGVSTWYFSRQKSVLYGPLIVSIKRALRYHIGSIALGSLGKLAKAPFDLFFISKLTQYIKSSPATKSKACCGKFCICARLFNSKFRYFTNYNYTFMSIFGDNYLKAGQKAYHLMRRNNIRIGRPCKFGSFIINMMKWVIILSGVSVSLALILFPKHSISGQLNIELTGLSGPILFSIVLSWFSGEVFGGALEVSLNTVLLSAACDEEMFVREQRFIENDLLEFMDGIGEEQNLYHKENKFSIKAAHEEVTSRFSFSDNGLEPDVFWANSKEISRDLSRLGNLPMRNTGKFGINRSTNQESLDRVEEIDEGEESAQYFYEAKYID